MTKRPRQVSVRGVTYERARAAASAKGQSVSKLVEEALGPLLGIDVSAGVDPAPGQG